MKNWMKKLFLLLVFFGLSLSSIAQEDSRYFLAYHLPEEISLFKLDGTVLNFELDEPPFFLYTTTRIADDAFLVQFINSTITNQMDIYFVSAEYGLIHLKYPAKEGLNMIHAEINALAFPYFVSKVRYVGRGGNTFEASLVLFDLRTGEARLLSVHPDQAPTDCCRFREDGQVLIYWRVDDSQVLENNRHVHYSLVELDLSIERETIIYETEADYPLEIRHGRPKVDLQSNEDGSLWLINTIDGEAVDFTLFNLEGEILWEESYPRIGACEPYVFFELGDLWHVNALLLPDSTTPCENTVLTRFGEDGDEIGRYSIEGVLVPSLRFPIFELEENRIFAAPDDFYILEEGGDTEAELLGIRSRALTFSVNNGISPDNRTIFLSDSEDSTVFRLIEIATGEVIWQGDDENSRTIRPYFDTPRYTRVVFYGYPNNSETQLIGASVRDNETGEVYDLEFMADGTIFENYYGEVFPDGTMLVSREGDVYLHTLETGEDALIAEDIGMLSEILDL
jgi:hypothetical protein